MFGLAPFCDCFVRSFCLRPDEEGEAVSAHAPEAEPMPATATTAVRRSRSSSRDRDQPAPASAPVSSMSFAFGSASQQQQQQEKPVIGMPALTCTSMRNWLILLSVLPILFSWGQTLMLPQLLRSFSRNSQPFPQVPSHSPLARLLLLLLLHLPLHLHRVRLCHTHPSVRKIL